MNREYFNNLKKEGYKCVELNKADYPIWHLWDTPEVILIEGLMYRDLLEDYIYFFGTRYEEIEFNENNQNVIVEKSENAVLKVDIHDSEDPDDVPNAEKLQGKIRSGYNPKLRDFLGNFIGVDTPYEFIIPGELKETFECKEAVEYLEEKYNL